MRGVIGHAGGWDELLFFLGPPFLYLLYRLLGKRPAPRAEDPPATPDETSRP